MTATFEDVIQQSQPAFYKGGAVGNGTAGSSWRWVLESPTGQDADWTDVVFTCEILDQRDQRTVVLDLTMEADEDNRLIITCAPDVTITIDDDDIESYPWRATAVKGDDVVTLWVAAASTFTVFPSTDVEGS